MSYIHKILIMKALPISLLLFGLLFINSKLLHSQTGPAGVGATATNALWLKADAGTSTTVSGAAISAWYDQSGNTLSVLQSIAAQRPTYTTTLMNGYPAIEFDNSTSSGQNDMMVGYDNPVLDNTTGYTFFTVSRIKGFDGNAKCIISKRTTIDIDEAFMLFYYTGNAFFLDVDGLSDRFSTISTYSANTNYIIDAVFDGSLTAANRSKIYEGENLRKTGSETSTLVPDKTSPLMVGATHATDNRPFNGYISEIIIYRTALNDAQRIIVNNYLSAKYDIALSANDKYFGDNNSDGDYDRDVAGVGKESSGSNNAFASSIAAGLGITVNSGLDIDDYIIAGHASPLNYQIISDVGGMTGTANARWQRIWYFDVTNSATNISTNVEFDMSDGITSWSTTLGSVSDYVLLYRAGQTGNWTELATASAITGDKVQFNGITFSGNANDGYYTIGTHNYPVSPLPIELLNFNAIKNGSAVDVTWETASETNNDYFTIEKSRDGITFETAGTVDGAGNSTGMIRYADKDYSPYSGISYYRLKQTDFNGHSTYSDLVPVNYYFGDDGITIYPNPAGSDEPLTMSITGLENQQVLVVVRDVSGKEFYSKVIITATNKEIIAIDPDQKLVAGTYIVIASSNNKLYSKKLIIR
ncbi:MAG: hypothetical protein JWP12_605 [Bacteroidetes bacterium]|nr:hypothetical protein [Bacteroidota bacterium]